MLLANRQISITISPSKYFHHGVCFHPDRPQIMLCLQLRQVIDQIMEMVRLRMDFTGHEHMAAAIAGKRLIQKLLDRRSNPARFGWFFHPCSVAQLI